MEVIDKRVRLILVKRMLAWLTMSALMVVAANLQAQPVAENVLDRVIIKSSDFTGIVKILFRLPVRYISHTPSKSGDEIIMKVDVIQNSLLRSRPSFGNGFQNDINSAQNNVRESVTPETRKNNFGLEEVIYEKNIGVEYISLYFEKDVSFEIIQDSSFRSISIIIHDVK